MYQVRLTCDGIADMPCWETRVNDLAEIASEAFGQLIKERLRRKYIDAPNGYQIADEMGRVVKSEKLF
jgi:hypothetical protein